MHKYVCDKNVRFCYTESTTTTKKKGNKMLLSRTSIKELKARYLQILRKCAWLNAIVLMGVALSIGGARNAVAADVPVSTYADLIEKLQDEANKTNTVTVASDITIAPEEGYQPSADLTFLSRLYNEGAVTFADKIKFDGVSLSGSSAVYGGAIYNTTGDITFGGETTTFDNNTASTTSSAVYGGAIYNTTGDITFNNAADFTKNTASASLYSYGGAIYNTGTIASITFDEETTFTDNTASSSRSNSYGGAISNTTGDIKFDGETNFTKNTASAYSNSYGGAIYNKKGNITFDNVADFIDNTASASNYSKSFGGAISNEEGNITFGGETAFTDNTASSSSNYSYGGAIYNTTGNITFDGETTFTRNTASSASSYPYGGAIYNTNGDITFGGKTTFIGNTASSSSSRSYLYGGAIYNTGTNASITFDNVAEFIGNTVSSSSSSYSRPYLYGGAIYNTENASITFNNVAEFIGNKALSKSDISTIQGGAIYSSAKLNLNGSFTFGDNIAQNSNDIYQKNGTTILATSENGVGSFAGGIAGSGTINKNGSGTVIFGDFSFNKEFTGSFTQTGGITIMSTDENKEHLFGGTTIINGGTLKMHGSSIAYDVASFGENATFAHYSTIGDSKDTLIKLNSNEFGGARNLHFGAYTKAVQEAEKDLVRINDGTGTLVDRVVSYTDSDDGKHDYNITDGLFKKNNTTETAYYELGRELDVAENTITFTDSNVSLGADTDNTYENATLNMDSSNILDLTDGKVDETTTTTTITKLTTTDTEGAKLKVDLALDNSGGSWQMTSDSQLASPSDYTFGIAKTQIDNTAFIADGDVSDFVTEIEMDKAILVGDTVQFSDNTPEEPALQGNIYSYTLHATDDKKGLLLTATGLADGSLEYVNKHTQDRTFDMSYALKDGKAEYTLAEDADMGVTGGAKKDILGGTDNAADSVIHANGHDLFNVVDDNTELTVQNLTITGAGTVLTTAEGTENTSFNNVVITDGQGDISINNAGTATFVDTTVTDTAGSVNNTGTMNLGGTTVLNAEVTGTGAINVTGGTVTVAGGDRNTIDFADGVADATLNMVGEGKNQTTYHFSSKADNGESNTVNFTDITVKASDTDYTGGTSYTLNGDSVLDLTDGEAKEVSFSKLDGTGADLKIDVLLQQKADSQDLELVSDTLHLSESDTDGYIFNPQSLIVTFDKDVNSDNGLNLEYSTQVLSGSAEFDGSNGTDTLVATQVYSYKLGLMDKDGGTSGKLQYVQLTGADIPSTDALNHIVQYNGQSAFYMVTDADNTYTVGSDLGTMSSGNKLIAGATTTASDSTIDAAGNNLFNMDKEETALTVKNITLTNATGESGVLTATAGTALFDNVVVSGTSSMSNGGDASLTLNKVTATDTTVINSSDLTVTESTLKSVDNSGMATLSDITVAALTNSGTAKVSDSTVTELSNAAEATVEVSDSSVITLSNTGTAELTEATVTTATNRGTLTAENGSIDMLTNESSATLTGTEVTTLTNSGTADLDNAEVTDASNSGTLTVKNSLIGTLTNNNETNLTTTTITTLSNASGATATVTEGTVGTLSNAGIAELSDTTVEALTNSGKASLTKGSVGAIDNSGTLNLTSLTAVGAINNKTTGAISLSGDYTLGDIINNGSITAGADNLTLTEDISGAGTLTFIDTKLTLKDGQSLGNKIVSNGMTFTGDNLKTLHFGDLVIAENTMLDISNIKATATSLDVQKDSTLKLTLNNASNFGSLQTGTVTAGENAGIYFNLTPDFVLGTYNIFGENATGYEALQVKHDSLFTVIVNNNGSYTFESPSPERLEEKYRATRNKGIIINGVLKGKGDNEAFNEFRSELMEEMQSQDPSRINAALKATDGFGSNINPVIESITTEHLNQIASGIKEHAVAGSEEVQGRNGGESALARASVWMKGFYDHTKYTDQSGFRVRSEGGVLGVQSRVREDLTIGVGYAYGTSVAKEDIRRTEADTNTGFIYAKYQPNNWFVNGQVSYGHSQYDEDLYVLSQKGKAKYDVDTFAVQGLTGYNINYNDVIVTPQTGLRYINIKQEAYTDSFGSKVNSNKYSYLTALAGVDVKSGYDVADTVTVTPKAGVLFGYDAIRDDVRGSIILNNGVGYVISGKALPSFSTSVEAGLDLTIGKNITATAGYVGTFRKDYQDHSGMIRIKYDF